MWEIFAVGIIIFFVFSYIGTFNVNTFIDDNKALFEKLREDDYNFLLIAKYGEQVDCNAKFNQRVKTSLVVFLIGMFFAITSVSNVNFAVKLVIVLFITYLIYKDKRLYLSTILDLYDRKVVAYQISKFNDLLKAFI